MRTTGLALLALMMCVMSGCLFTSKRTVDESGVRISPSTLSQVEIGETSEAWLIATLGQPTARVEVDERTDILRYQYRREEKSGGTVFLLFAGGSKSKESSTTFFEVTDGIVTRHWTEA